MRARRRIHAAALAALFFFAYAWFLPPGSPELFGTNNAVRFYLAKSLAFDGDVTIERYYRGGIDAASFGGHLYSGKAPAASCFAAPVIRLVSLVAKAPRAVPDRVYLYLARVAVISIPSVAMILALHGFLLRLGVSDRRADLLCLGYGLGTMAFPYSTEFVGHQLAAAFLFFGFLALASARGIRGPGRFGASTVRCAPFAAAGLCAGFAVASDYQTALIAALLFAAMVPLRRPRCVAAFAFGCIPGAAMILAYNHACFGNPLSFPYAHEAMPIARQVQGQGLFGVQTPRLVPLAKLAFSPWRGLFFGSPFLLLAAPGLRALWRGEAGDAAGIGDRRLAAICLCACGGYLLFNSSYGAWSGGAGYGPRFLVPAIPFLCIPVAAFAVRASRGAWILAAALIACSVAYHLVGTAAGPLAHEYLRNPVREFLLPSLLRGNVRPNWGAEAGWPPAAGLAALVAILSLCGVVARSTAKGGTGGEGRRRPDPAGRALLFLCAAAAGAMALLFLLHRTEETAYRYGVLGHGYEVAGDADAAIACFEKSLEMDPRDGRVIDDLTRLLIERGDHRRALEANIRAFSVAPRPQAGERCALLARLASLSERIATSPGDAALRAEHARLLEGLGVQTAATPDGRNAAGETMGRSR
ncbi:MAG TPA: hypothetical protein PK696_07055 [bacterium]|nr:hypothetical protein [Chlamydiota bacterium]HOE27437.1 hypothetical protein [bacterium]